MSNVKCQILLSVVVTTALLAGCQPARRIAAPGAGCSGKPTIAQAVAALQQQRGQLDALQAAARSVMEWRDIDNRTRRESFDAQIRFVPPDKIFFRGDKFGEIRFGANESEFWLRIKPELDTYWYGGRDRAEACSHMLPMNPANLAEAMGMVAVDTRWELFHRDGWDILTLRGERGQPQRRVFVNGCTYRVERIEYYDHAGQMTAATELSGYETTGDGMTLPTSIRLMTIYKGQEESAAQFTLRNVRRFEPTDRQRQNLFARPDRDGYGTVLRLDEYCNFVRE